MYKWFDELSSIEFYYLRWHMYNFWWKRMMIAYVVQIEQLLQEELPSLSFKKLSVFKTVVASGKKIIKLNIFWIYNQQWPYSVLRIRVFLNYLKDIKITLPVAITIAIWKVRSMLIVMHGIVEPRGELFSGCAVACSSNTPNQWKDCPRRDQRSWNIIYNTFYLIKSLITTIINYP